MALGQAWHMAGPLGRAWHMAHGTRRMACRQSWDMLGAAPCRCHSTGRHAGPCQELTAEPLTNRKVRRTSRSRGCPGRAERRGAERGRRRRRQRRRWAGAGARKQRGHQSKERLEAGAGGAGALGSLGQTDGQAGREGTEAGSEGEDEDEDEDGRRRGTGAWRGVGNSAGQGSVAPTSVSPDSTSSSEMRLCPSRRSSYRSLTWRCACGDSGVRGAGGS